MASLRTKLIAGGALWLVVAATLVFATTYNAAPTQFPDGPGQVQVQAACGPCHAVTIVTGARKTETEWERTVEAMITRGARVSDQDYDVIVDYLIRNFGTR